MKKSTKKGFTLVELVIVIAVIAILSAILIPTFGNVISNANETKYQSGAKAGYEEVLANHINENPEISDYDMLLVYFDTKIVTGTSTVSKSTRAYLANGGNLTLLDSTTLTSKATGSNVDIVITVENKKPQTIGTDLGVTAWPDAGTAVTPNTYLYRVNDNVAVLFYKAA